MDRNGWNNTGAILGRKYIKFYCQCKDYDRKNELDCLVLAADATSAGAEVNPTVVTTAIAQEGMAPLTNSGSSGLVIDILSDSEEDDMNDDEDLHGFPSDEEVREQDKMILTLNFKVSSRNGKNIFQIG